MTVNSLIESACHLDVWCRIELGWVRDDREHALPRVGRSGLCAWRRAREHSWRCCRATAKRSGCLRPLRCRLLLSTLLDQSLANGLKELLAVLLQCRSHDPLLVTCKLRDLSLFTALYHHHPATLAAAVEAVSTSSQLVDQSFEYLRCFASAARWRCVPSARG